MNLFKLLLCSFFLLISSACVYKENSPECSQTNPICYKNQYLTIAKLDRTTHNVDLVDSYGTSLGTFKIYSNDFWACYRGCRSVGDSFLFSIKYKYVNPTTKTIIGVSPK
ncbi:hypothetical protein FDH01_gp302 [Acinetobacter phage vB_AbaM_ME3]|uniref:Lipoprotein n=1 Tax=Acinetobacter phage vB_AbaM_ME3 TaxID=1837876 RepID=A0A172Q0D2_9CAUD|nr:hypothetical protein FDH01_gp302 [Acinetobacter phage vB_AbaM_ME3]AND75320.1 hypothetical protein ME3_159 [Acinetobacter phage vB_AbaM_ME3]